VAAIPANPQNSELAGSIWIFDLAHQHININ
jgi:hypothetical protein